MLHITVHPYRKAHPKDPHFVAAADNANHAVDIARKSLEQINKSAALRAFRATKVDPFSKLPKPVMNRSANLRGIVLSKKAQSIYDISFKYAEKIAKYDRLLLAAGFLVEVAKDYNQYKAVYQSNRSAYGKSMAFAGLLASDAFKTVTGIIPDGVHIVALSLEGYCDLAQLGGVEGANKASNNIKQFDTWVHTEYEELVNPKTIGNLQSDTMAFIKAHVNFG